MRSRSSFVSDTGHLDGVDCLGQALSFATSDVTTKLEHVTNRTKEMIETGIIGGPFESVTLEVAM